MNQFEVGHRSDDGVVLVGAEGTLFVVGGSNDAASQYATSPEALANASALAGHWRHRFCQRANDCAALGARYLQMIIPEKQSVMPALFPDAILPPTPLLRGIETDLHEDWYISALDVLRSADTAERVFRSADSHLTTAGAQEVVAAMMLRLGWTMPPPPTVSWTEWHSDLFPKLSGAPHLEPCQGAISWQGVPDPLKVSEVVVAGHVGRQAIFRSEEAPNRCTVICFGNSFFEGGTASNQLTWWLSRLCTEFHFIWSPEFDHDYIASVKPDLVIGQTIERFLQVIPGR